MGFGGGSEEAEVPPGGGYEVDADSGGLEFRHVAEASRRHGGGRHGSDGGEENGGFPFHREYLEL